MGQQGVKQVLTPYKFAGERQPKRRKEKNKATTQWKAIEIAEAAMRKKKKLKRIAKPKDLKRSCARQRSKKTRPSMIKSRDEQYNTEATFASSNSYLRHSGNS